MTLDILIIVLQVVAIGLWKNREIIVDTWNTKRRNALLAAGWKETIEYQRYQLGRRQIESIRLLATPIRRTFDLQFGTKPISLPK